MALSVHPVQSPVPSVFMLGTHFLEPVISYRGKLVEMIATVSLCSVHVHSFKFFFFSFLTYVQVSLRK